MPSIVIMGVAGCGKSSLAALIAQRNGLKLVEGDDHHSLDNRRKMSQGVALTDEDRDGWLTTLSELLHTQSQGVVLTCSALKRIYRDRLRSASPGLRFVFLEISPAQAQARVTARAHAHFFSSTLVESQFATLEVPTGEPGVLRLDACSPLPHMQTDVAKWLHNEETV